MMQGSNAVAIVACCFIAATTLAQKSPTTQESDEALKARSLSKVSAFYLLPGDAHLTDELKPLRQSQLKVQQFTRKRSTIQHNIESAMREADRQFQLNHDLDDQLKTIPQSERDRYNGMVDQVNSAGEQYKQYVKYAQSQLKEFEDLPDPRADYVAAMVTVSNTLESTSKQYETVAADDEVKNTLAGINETSKVKYKLGPSPRFVQELANIRRESKRVQTESIKLEMRDAPYADVTINGNNAEKMVVNPETPTVLLTYAMAEKLGLHAFDPGFQAIKFTLANGIVVDASEVVLHSVRVGQFNAEDIKGIVLSGRAGNFDCVLGASFLKYFNAKLDKTAGTLEMTQIRTDDFFAVTQPAASEGARSLFESPPDKKPPR
jgi:gag-polyprotein putative aspartyl protease